MQELYTLLIQAEDVLRQAKFIAIREPLARVEVDEQRADDHLRFALGEVVQAINHLEMAAALRYDESQARESTPEAESQGTTSETPVQVAGTYNEAFFRRSQQLVHDSATPRRRPGRPRKIREANDSHDLPHPQVPDVLPDPRDTLKPVDTPMAEESLLECAPPDAAVETSPCDMVGGPTDDDLAGLSF